MTDVYFALYDQHENYCKNISSSRIYCLITFALSNDTNGNDKILVKQSENLRSNISLLVNMTSDHATPIYVNEILFRTNYDFPSALINLFNYPLHLDKQMSFGAVLRGFIGSNNILIFILISSASVVKSIIKLRANGSKHQLHLAGVTCSIYWISNFIFDSTLMMIKLLIIMLAVWMGGFNYCEFMWIF